MTAFSCGLSFSIRVIASPTSSAGETSFCADQLRLSRRVQPCRVVAHGRTVPRRAAGRARAAVSAQAGTPTAAPSPSRAARPAARPGADGDRLGDRDVGAAGDAAAPVVDLAPAASMLQDHRPLTLEPVAVAPLEQRDEDGPQVGALLGQAVLAAQRALLVRPLHQDALLDEALEPRLQHVAGDAQVALQLLEAPDPQEDVPDDEQCPALAHHLERRRHRAVLVGVVTLQHHPSLPHISAKCVVS